MTKAKAPKGGDAKAPKGAGVVKGDKRKKLAGATPLADPRVQTFIAAVGDGADQAAAYVTAFGAGVNGKPRKPESTQQLASRLAARADVKAAIADLQKSRYIGDLWTAEKSAKVKLTTLKMAKEAEDYSGMLKATDALDKQFGVGAPVKIDLTNSDGSLMPQRIILVAADAAKALGDDA